MKTPNSSPKKSRSFDNALLLVRSMLSAAQQYQKTSHDIHADFLSLRGRFHLPTYRWEYLRGYYAAISDGWYQRDLMFCYLDLDGTVWPGNWENLPEHMREHIRSHKTDELRSGHYWKNSDGTPGRPFFVNGVTHKLGEFSGRVKPIESVVPPNS
jgi:hypothetical protein